ncbi:MAG: SCP2 sterol-binding domain-containing protein [Alphaproteobacteria bacterium]|nr:SCP2 sterol-binding domain-containing protein [Alphaproteobacteria bacterium]MCL2505981.1 SCP2 sterol-binding domain-containing protein [Alphaproteobacteria bacterium]
MPVPLVQAVTDLALLHIKNKHPSLFSNLKALPKSQILIELSDFPFFMLFSFGNKADASIDILDPLDSMGYTTKIKGSLETLLLMLEGKTDGDEEFFSRSIQIFGNTSSIVSFRNVLDREAISLYDDIVAPLGAFAPFVISALNIADSSFSKLSPMFVSSWNDLRKSK